MRIASVQVGITLAFFGVAAVGVRAQQPDAGGGWFGLTRPAVLAPHSLEVLSGRPAVPVLVRAGEERHADLNGDSIQALLETIVGISHESRRTGEIGGGQLWGRVSGFPSGAKTVQWATDELRAAGITDVEL